MLISHYDGAPSGGGRDTSRTCGLVTVRSERRSAARRQGEEAAQSKAFHSYPGTRRASWRTFPSTVFSYTAQIRRHRRTGCAAFRLPPRRVPPTSGRLDSSVRRQSRRQSLEVALTIAVCLDSGVFARLCRTVLTPGRPIGAAHRTGSQARVPQKGLHPPCSPSSQRSFGTPTPGP